jgi:subtilase family serine protease
MNKLVQFKPAKLLVLILICSFLITVYPLQVASAQTAVVSDNTSGGMFEPFSIFEPFAGGSTGYGYTPTQIKTAYNLPSTGGSGVTIAIIVAYDTPNIKDYLTTFSNEFSLPVPTDSNFEVHKMSSTMSSIDAWSKEACLNVEWAHAIAPQAKILLVEAADGFSPQILAAVDYVKTRADVTVASMSYGIGEGSDTLSWDSHLSGTDIVFFAAAGNTASAVYWPASSPYVVSVGGTKLTLNSDGSIASEIAWYKSSGGVSSNEPIPAYQTSYGITGTYRNVPDVSYNADETVGYPIYYNGAWYKVWGTSAAAPQWAAIYALGRSASNSNLYASATKDYSAYFNDIVSGSNGHSAIIGYDLATGLGSPKTVNFYSSPLSVLPEGSEIAMLAAILAAALFVGLVKKKKK